MIVSRRRLKAAQLAAMAPEPASGLDLVRLRLHICVHSRCTHVYTASLQRPSSCCTARLSRCDGASAIGQDGRGRGGGARLPV